MRPRRNPPDPPHENHPDNLSLVEALAVEIRAIVERSKSEPLFWLMALRRVAHEIERHPGNPKTGPTPGMPTASHLEQIEP